MQKAETPRNAFCLLASRCLKLSEALKHAQSSHLGIRMEVIKIKARKQAPDLHLSRRDMQTELQKWKHPRNASPRPAR